MPVPFLHELKDQNKRIFDETATPTWKPSEWIQKWKDLKMFLSTALMFFHNLCYVIKAIWSEAQESLK